MVVFGVAFFGLTSLAIAWFGTLEGVAGPVTELGYGALIGGMGAQAQDLVGPPHHVQRLSTMAAMAIAIVLVALLASLKTRGWRIPPWCAGLAAVVFGLASAVYPDHPAADGFGWGAAAPVGGVLFIAVAEWEARKSARTASADRPKSGRRC